MGLSRYLLDKSALARSAKPAVRQQLLAIREQHALVTCSITNLEILYSARSPSDYAITRDNLKLAYETLAIDQQILERAVEIQGLLASKSQHRGVSLPDLIIAAAAEKYGACVLHYDHDYELISSISNQAIEWVVPPGSVD